MAFRQSSQCFTPPPQIHLDKAFRIKCPAFDAVEGISTRCSLALAFLERSPLRLRQRSGFSEQIPLPQASGRENVVDRATCPTFQERAPILALRDSQAGRMIGMSGAKGLKAAPRN